MTDTENRTLLARAGGDLSLHYKVVELSMVTDDEIESALNEWTEKGWTFDTMHFAMREGSKRPSMAFVTFTRSADEAAD